jgi:hypothetical protein
MGCAEQEAGVRVKRIFNFGWKISRGRYYFIDKTGFRHKGHTKILQHVGEI